MLNQAGLEWVLDLFGSEPRWTVEPSSEVVTEIAGHHLKLSEAEKSHLSVTFHSQGGLNKLYAVTCLHRSCMMRVSLPVDPRFKTLSEIATIEHVQSSTSIPVPNVIAFDSSRDNELGFEWILMERIAGWPLEKIWSIMDWDSKDALVRRVAGIVAQLFRLRFSRLGNVYRVSDVGSNLSRFSETLPANEIVVNRIVSMPFLWDTHIHQDVPRGPFSNSRDWLYSTLSFILNDCDRTIAESNDAGVVEDAEDAKLLAERLLKNLPIFFPSNEDGTEKFALHHDDISSQNILVDNTGSLTGLVDWECVSVLPLWKVCQFPSLLEGPDRGEAPQRDHYRPDEDASDTVNSLYSEHLHHYELTRLRRVFLEEMEKLEPEWVEEHRASVMKADFDFAIQNCDNAFVTRRINKWLDGIESGEVVRSLREMILS